MRRYRLVIAPPAAEIIRTLHPDLKRSVRSALAALGGLAVDRRALAWRALAGLWRYRVRRFRIVYTVNRTTSLVRVLAVGPRQSIYENLAAARRRQRREG